MYMMMVDDHRDREWNFLGIHNGEWHPVDHHLRWRRHGNWNSLRRGWNWKWDSLDFRWISDINWKWYTTDFWWLGDSNWKNDSLNFWWLLYRNRYRERNALQLWRRGNFYRDWDRHISDLRRGWNRDGDFLDFWRRRHVNWYHDWLYGGWARHRDGVRNMFDFRW